MFYNSLTKVEQQHIISAIQFELGKVEDENIHKIMVKSLNNVGPRFHSFFAVLPRRS
jgi:catalase